MEKAKVGYFRRNCRFVGIAGKSISDSFLSQLCRDDPRARSAWRIWWRGDLTSIPSIGKITAEKIKEILESRNLPTSRRIAQESPPAGLADLIKVAPLGPRRAMILYRKLHIHSLDNLKIACEEVRLARLKGMGIRKPTATAVGSRR
jgi:DNA polymerase/3'-5' exonuclease PolX